MEIGRAGPRMRPRDEDRGQSETPGGLEVVVGVSRDVPPRFPEGDARAGGDAAPEFRIGLVAADFFRADPAVEVKAQIALRLSSLDLVAVRARDAGSEGAKFPHGFSRVGVERPGADLRGDRAGRRDRDPEHVDQARGDDGGVGTKPAGFELRLEVDHPVEVRVAERGAVAAERVSQSAAPIDDRAEDVECQDLRMHSRVSSTARRRSAATAAAPAREGAASG